MGGEGTNKIPSITHGHLSTYRVNLKEMVRYNYEWQSRPLYYTNRL